MRWLLLVVLAACGRVNFAAVADAPAVGAPADATTDAGVPGPVHRYAFHGDLRDDLGGPPLTALMAGTFVATGYRFVANGGLVLPGIAFPPNAYTIEVSFALDAVTSWRKVLDFDGGALDRGFYVYEAAIQQVVVPYGSPMPDFVTSVAAFMPGVQARVVLTRDAANRGVGYVNGMPARGARAVVADVPASPAGAFDFDDAGRTMRLNAADARWFVDDTATGGEASAGVVRQISIWDVALTADQIAEL
jgi:hypothetical protein